MTQFLHEDIQIDTHVGDIVEHAFNAPLHDHKTTLEEETEKKEEKQEEILRIKREKAEKKSTAKEEAEAKRKAEELQNLKNDIKANFIKKGDLRDRIILQDMTDPHGNIGEWKVMGAVGGQLGQIIMVISAALTHYKE